VPDLHRLLAAEPEPFELAGRVGIGVDAHPTAQIDGQLQKFLRRITSLRARIDLDRRPSRGAGAEHDLGVEARRLPDLARKQPAVQWPRMSL